MNVNINTNSNYSFDKSLFDYIYNSLKEMANNVTKFFKNNDYNNESVEKLIASFQSLEDNLEQISFLHKEYEDFISISLISRYILQNKCNEENLSLIIDMLDGFHDLLKFKFKLNSTQYKKKYGEFILKMFNWEEKFYLEIYENGLCGEMCSFNPFDSIFHFIKCNILPKYPSLLNCKMFNSADDEFSKEYYFKYDDGLSFDEVNRLHHDILEDIYYYCSDLDYLDYFNRISVFLSR